MQAAYGQKGSLNNASTPVLYKQLLNVLITNKGNINNINSTKNNYNKKAHSLIALVHT